MIRSAGKPVVVALMGEDMIVHAARLFRQAHVPGLPLSGAGGIGAAGAGRAGPSSWRRRPVQPRRPRAFAGKRPRRAGRTATRGGTGSWGRAPQRTSWQAYGVRIAGTELARTPEDAAAAARRIGYPVVLKIASPDMPHKSDVGGVLLGSERAVRRDRGLRAAYARRRGSSSRSARIAGCTGPRRGCRQGQEVIVGVVRDAQFGPLVMFGSGGVEVEGLNDVAFALAPLERGRGGSANRCDLGRTRMRGLPQPCPGRSGGGARHGGPAGAAGRRLSADHRGRNQPAAGLRGGGWRVRVGRAHPGDLGAC